MRFEKLTPIELLRWLYSTISNHIGAGDKAHAVADDEHSGFMSVDSYINLMAANGRRKKLSNGADVLNLDFGNYECVNPTNGPSGANGLCMIDVKKSPTGLHEIVLYQSSIGKIWYRTLSIGSANVMPNAPTQWTWVPRRTTLWTGTVLNVGDQMTLSDGVDKYDWLWVTYVTTARDTHVMKVYPQQGWFAISGINPSSNVNVPGNSVLRTVVDQKANVLTIASMIRYDQRSDGTIINNSGDAGLQITRIEGER